MGEPKALVSVVTPFYNTADYLRECIESVLRQTHMHFEYVLVDNQSTDGSAQIAEEYARRDPRVRLVRNTTFLGKVENYNHALEQISPDSRYCKIVQADDWILEDCLEKMVRLAEAHPRVGLVSSYFMLGTRVQNVGLPFTESVFGGRDICRMQLLDGRHFYFGNYTTVMTRAEVVRSRRPFFALDTYNDDTESCYETLKDWDFGFVHQILSFTREGNESLSKSVETYRPELADYLIALRRYGPAYLDAAELKRRSAEMEHEYLRYLGLSAIEGREPSFWEFQREGLKIAGVELDRGRVARYAARELLALAIHPRRLAKALRARLRRPRAGG